MPVTLPRLLEGKNPCDIPEKDLKKELKRCKHCPTFSGINVSMEMSCKSKPRTIRMDILDRDLFDNRTATPGNTSWTMRLTGTLDEALKTGLWDKPIFNLETSGPIPQAVRRAKIVQAIEAGEYDHFFPSDPATPETLSQLSKDAELPPPVLLTKLVEAKPNAPVKVEMPNYPPIARAAHVQGDVEITFDVTPEGKTDDLTFPEGDRLLMLHNAVKEAVAQWTFPATGEHYQERATVSFGLGCAAPAK